MAPSEAQPSRRELGRGGGDGAECSSILARNNGAKGKNLFQEIDDLAAKGVLPPIIKEWASNVRELGNDAAHPTPGEEGPSPADARDIVRFLDFLLEYLYSLHSAP